MGRNLFQLCGIVSLLSLLSKCLGVYRDAEFLKVLGTGVGADLFVVADRVQRSIQNVFSDALFPQAVLPVLAEYQGKSKRERRIRVERKTLGGGFALISLVCLAMFLFAPVIGAIFCPGWFWAWVLGHPNAPRYGAVVHLLRCTLPFLFTMSAAALLSVLLNLRKRYTTSALIPVLFNSLLIAACQFVLPRSEDRLLALCYALGVCGAACLLMQMGAAMWEGIPVLRPKLALEAPALKRMRQLATPVFWGAISAQLASLLSVFIGSFLETGAVSCLHYAYRLSEVPSGALAVGFSTLLLPVLSRQHHKDLSSDTDVRSPFRGLLWSSFKMCLFALVPLVVMMASLGELWLEFAYSGSSLSSASKGLILEALHIYNVACLPHNLARVLSVACYARQDAVTAIRCGLLGALIEVGVSLGALLFGPLWVCAGYGLSGAVRTALLWKALGLGKTFRSDSANGIYLFRTLLASCAMLGVLESLKPSKAAWCALPWSMQFSGMVGLVMVSVLAYFGTAALLGWRPKDLSSTTVSLRSGTDPEGEEAPAAIRE